jgi:2-hydroxy-3-keto-5-methylthiopentenyl-1-phosphate phosphatase
MRIKSGFAKREIAGSIIVVPVGKESSEFNGMITLNDSASYFWDCFQEERTVDEVAKLTTQEYDVEFDRAKSDIEKFTNMLKENNLLA